MFLFFHLKRSLIPIRIIPESLSNNNNRNFRPCYVIKKSNKSRPTWNLTKLNTRLPSRKGKKRLKLNERRIPTYHSTHFPFRIFSFFRNLTAQTIVCTDRHNKLPPFHVYRPNKRLYPEERWYLAEQGGGGGGHSVGSSGNLEFLPGIHFKGQWSASVFVRFAM